MKIGIVSNSLDSLSFGQLLEKAADIKGVEGIEIGTANWSQSKHIALDTLLESSDARDEYTGLLQSKGIAIIALNCNGNQLHPVSGSEQDQAVRDTIRLSGLLGLKMVCAMSGLPGGSPGDKTPNWIVSSWPPETQQILAWQWNEKLVPYWKALKQFAHDHGVQRIALELHGGQLVYNVPTLLRLRSEIGDFIGANLDPSHLFWMDADPIAATKALAGAIYHVHAKDVWMNESVQALHSRLDTGPMNDIQNRSWNYITLGFGHGNKWWRQFCYALRLAGYDEWLSIEHEDATLSCEDGIRKSVDLLRDVAPSGASDYQVPEV